MKKIIIFVFIFFIFIFYFISPIKSQVSNNTNRFIGYFFNIYGEFTPFEINYAFDNLNIYLKSQHKIEFLNNGLSSRALSLELLRKENLKCLAEFSGKVTNINYSNSQFKTDISLKLIFDSISTDQIDLEVSKDFEGVNADSINDSKSFTLSKAFIDIFAENIDKIKEILTK